MSEGPAWKVTPLVSTQSPQSCTTGSTSHFPDPVPAVVGLHACAAAFLSGEERWTNHSTADPSSVRLGFMCVCVLVSVQGAVVDSVGSFVIEHGEGWGEGSGYYLTILLVCPNLIYHYTQCILYHFGVWNFSYFYPHTHTHGRNLYINKLVP